MQQLSAIAMLLLCAVATAAGSASEVFFAPYDSSTPSPFGTSFNATQSDLALIYNVSDAARESGSDNNNNIFK